MDDIIVSAAEIAPLQEIAESIQNRAEQSDLPLNLKKTQGPSPQIEAFNIILKKNSLSITDIRLAELATTFATSASEDVRAGILGYVESVNASQSAAVGSKV